MPDDTTQTLTRRDYSQAERDQMDDSDFAGPHQSFPIQTQADVDNAARLIGHAADPAAVKARIIAIATRKGFTLPQSWQEDEQHQDHKERAAMPTIDRAGNHAPMTGTHTHAHPAFGSQGGDETHEHEHSHSDDAVHDHSHDDAASRAVAAPGAVTQSERVNMSLPLTRIDATKREVWGQATAEVPDSYGTIFGYYPDAWKSWRGNIREQHDGKKAVGRRVELECDEQARAIYVGSRISRGAQDTWLKVEDNVLTGYSASIIPDPEFGTDPRTWPKKEYQGKQYPYLPRYTVAELSLVDNPACPGCDIQIVRADGFITDITEEPEPEPATPAASTPAPEQQPLERAGATISAATKSKLHDSIGHTLQAAKSQMQNCADAGCADCAAALKQIDPDGDGDIDAFGGAFGDTDGDAASLAAASGDESDMERTVTGMVERVLDRALAPVYARLQGIAGTLARSHAGSSTPPAPVADLDTLISGAITRAVDAATIASSSSLDEVRAELSAVKGQVEVIAKQPMPGAPIQHAGTMPRSTEKRLATDPFQMQRRSGSPVFDALSEMRERGDLSTIQRQEDAATAALLAQRGGL